MPKQLTIKSESGQEVDLERWKKLAPAAVSLLVVPSSPTRWTVQKEAEKAKAEAEEGEVQELEQTAEATDEAAQEAKDKDSNKAPFWIDTALTSADGKRRPSHLDLSGTKSRSIPAALPSALVSTRTIKDIASIQYPKGVKSPKPDLIANAKQGKLRDFQHLTVPRALVQFAQDYQWSAVIAYHFDFHYKRCRDMAQNNYSGWASIDTALQAEHHDLEADL
ncbi:hypothetical protein V8D89_004256 [Ganoderma adspersum]